MRICLVHPAGSNWIPGQRDVTPVANRMAPLGLLSLASYLEARGHRVRVVDCLGPRAPRSTADAARRVLEGDPDLVGLSVTTSAFPEGLHIAGAIKEERPRVVTVLGGVHAAALGGALLEGPPAIDAVCLGEGERPLAALARGARPEEVPGVAARDGEGPSCTHAAEPITELDSLPLPAYHLLDGFPRSYNLPLFSYERIPGASMVTSRGCKYACSYCDRSVFGRSFRSNSAEYVYDHMRWLRRRYGVRHIAIYDDLFTQDRERIEELCEMLARRPLGVQFNCAVRVRHAPEELLVTLRRAGCFMVSVGIESGDQEILRRHKAGVQLDEVRDTVARIQRAGLRAKGLFMMGLPGETEASIRATTDYCLSLGLDDMNMAKFTPFPGAPAWQSIDDEGERRGFGSSKPTLRRRMTASR